MKLKAQVDDIERQMREREEERFNREVFWWLTEAVLATIFEPLDWALNIRDILSGQATIWTFMGFLPILSASWSNLSKIAPGWSRSDELNVLTDVPASHPLYDDLDKLDQPPRIYEVVPEMRKFDEGFEDDLGRQVIVDGQYIINPSRNLIDQSTIEVTLSGKIKIDSNLLNGEYMYVVNLDGQIYFGTRAGGKMPHPTLIGGENPQVLSAGIAEVRGGKLYVVDNVSGHYRPDASSLEIAEIIFRDVLPEHAFTHKFEGFQPFTGD